MELSSLLKIFTRILGLLMGEATNVIRAKKNVSRRGIEKQKKKEQIFSQCTSVKKIFMASQETLEQLRKAREPKQKKVYKGIAKKSPKKIAHELAEKDARGDNDTELQRWFRSKIKMSTGHCTECGCRVEKNIFQYAVMTVAHLLPKRENCCPSVKTNPLNFIILCPDHHDMFDRASWEEKELMGCWDTVRDRLIFVYTDLAEQEKRHFPQSVLEYMKKLNPF